MNSYLPAGNLAGAGSGSQTTGAAYKIPPSAERRSLHAVTRPLVEPVTILVVSTQAVVTAGIGAVMAGAPHVSVRSGPARSTSLEAIDVAIYDVSGLAHGHLDLDRLVRQPGLPVLALTFSDRSELGRAALARGANALLPPGLPSSRIRDCVLGAVRRPGGPGARPVRNSDREGLHAVGSPPTCDDWNLSPRELEVLRLIATGISNTAIASQMYLSINSVKTYIRSAYRRIGVERRAQAVAWCYQYGLGERSEPPA